MSNIQSNQLQLNEDPEIGRYLTFTLDEEDYGIAIGFVTEIISMQPVVHLPEVPDYIRGIINLRGKIIPVIDLRLKFKKDPTLDTERTCIIVIHTGGLSVGLIVDKVFEVMTIDDIAPPPNLNTGTSKKYIQGIGKTDHNIILLINCDMLFQEDDAEMINNINGRTHQ